MPDYKRFYEYWHDLYGTGLRISGWHMNGELEDFDNFFDSAIEYMEGVSYMPTFQGKTVNELNGGAECIINEIKDGVVTDFSITSVGLSQ